MSDVTRRERKKYKSIGCVQLRMNECSKMIKNDNCKKEILITPILETNHELFLCFLCDNISK